MAYTLLLDTVTDAEVQDSLRTRSRFVRTGIVGGLTTAVTSSTLALLDAVSVTPGMPAKGSILHASYPQYILQHRVARGIENTKGTKARVWLHYETLGGGGTPMERFAAQDTTSLSVEPRQTLPGTLKPFLLSMNNTAVNYTTDPQPANVVTVTSSHPREYRALILFGLFADRPNISVLDAANCVNNATWQGLAKGYWRCGGPDVRYSSRDGMYAITVGFMTKGDQDWSTYEFGRDPITGKLATPTTTIMDVLRAQTYVNDVVYAKNGVLKYGGYPLANFATIFGTSFPIGD